MRLPRLRLHHRPRLRLRTLLIVVAVVAVALGIGMGLYRRAESLRRLEYYEYKARYHRMMEHSTIILVEEGGIVAGPDELARLNATRTAYHASMRRKYEKASAVPWEAVPPDPPEPFKYSGPGRRVNAHFGD